MALGGLVVVNIGQSMLVVIAISGLLQLPKMQVEKLMFGFTFLLVASRGRLVLLAGAAVSVLFFWVCGWFFGYLTRLLHFWERPVGRLCW